jgi:AcrR family transcriptional regulator
MAKAERRREILKAAADAFASKGYRLASIDDIAKAAGISKALFYRHFGSKKQAFDELIQLFFSGFYGVLQENHGKLADAFAYKKDLTEIMSIWYENILRILQYLFDNSRLTTIVFEKAIGSDEDISKRLSELFNRAGEMIAEEYRMSARNGTLRASDIELAAQLSMGSLVFIVLDFNNRNWNDLDLLAYRILEYHARALAPAGMDDFEGLERLLVKKRRKERSATGKAIL